MNEHLDTIHVVTELIAYVFTIFCFRSAWKNGGWPLVVVVITAGIYGFILEYASVRSNSAYCYDPAMILVPWWPVAPLPGDPCTIGPAVPLWIVFGWMMTIYIAMQTSTRLKVPFLLRPVIDGLVGMGIDWILDPIAARVHFWVWYHPGPYFGIPLDNYFGWFTIIASFSLALRVAQRAFASRGGQWAIYAPPLIAAVFGILAVMKLVDGFEALGKYVSEALMLAVVLGGSFLLVLPWRIKLRGTLPPDWFIISEAVFFTLYYSFLLWITGVYAEHPMLIPVSFGVLLIVLLGYGWPYSFRRPNAPPNPAGPRA